MTEVRKIPPLKCPKCESDRVRKTGLSWKPGNCIECFDCHKITNEKTGEAVNSKWKPGAARSKVRNGGGLV